MPKESILCALTEQVAYQILVERVGCHNLHIRVSRFVQYLTCLDGQVSDIARVQTDALGTDAHGCQHLVCHTDGVGHARLEYIIGINQEDTVVRIDLGVSLERLDTRNQTSVPRNVPWCRLPGCGGHGRR